MTALQADRIAALCEQLKLARLATEWSALAQDAARTEASFADFLERVSPPDEYSPFPPVEYSPV